MILSIKQITKALIRSAALLFAHPENRFSCVETYIIYL